VDSEVFLGQVVEIIVGVDPGMGPPEEDTAGWYP
jgi:hypothetical protein